MSARKLDIYNHVLPRAVTDRMRELAPAKGDIVKRVTSIRVLHDIPARIAMMDQWPGYQQVLTLANPPLEAMAGPDDCPGLAEIGNDALADICARWPEKFPAWVASLPLNNVPASLVEMDRAIAAGARGPPSFTNANGRPRREPEVFPVFERPAQPPQAPLWMRSPRRADTPPCR